MKGFKYNNLSEIWVEQEADDSCVANALRMCLRYFGFDAKEKEIVDFIHKKGYFVYFEDEYLFCPPYALLFLKQSGFRVKYRITTKHEIAQSNTKLEDLRCLINEDMYRVDSEYLKDCYRALIEFIDLGGDVTLDPKIDKNTIMTLITNGKVVIALVTAKEYYGVDESWWHALTLVPYNNTFYVFDGFKFKGYEYEDLRYEWDKALETTKKFKWNKTIELIEVWR